MKVLLIGIGAAGNKAVVQAINDKVVSEEDSIIINSTDKDFPENFGGKKIILSPNNQGCGKERATAFAFAKNLIQSDQLNIDCSKYTTVVVCASVEGGTGSGSAPLIAKYFKHVHNRNVHVIAFIGFEDDPRGLSNTVEFFKELESDLIVQTIRNASFMKQAGNNKFKAEELANKEMSKRIKIITGQNFIASEQNIDDTDILKVSNTSGYMTVEEKYLDKNLETVDDFNKVVKNMVYNSHSIKSNSPNAIRIGIILNIDPNSEDAIDYSFKDIKDSYGLPYETYLQKQWDGDREYIQWIVSGMQMPLDEIKEIYDRYLAESDKVQKDADAFFKTMEGMQMDSSNNRFDMIKPEEKKMSVKDFLGSFN